MVVDDSQQFVRQFPTFVIFLGPVVTVLYLLAAAGGKQQTLPCVDSSLMLMDLPTPPQAVLIWGVSRHCPYSGHADELRSVWSEATICVAIGVIVLGTLFLLKNHYRLARDILDTANKAAKAHWSVFWTVLIGQTTVGHRKGRKTDRFSRFNYPVCECYLECFYLYSCFPPGLSLGIKVRLDTFFSSDEHMLTRPGRL